MTELRVLRDAGEPAEAEERARGEDIREGVDAKASHKTWAWGECIVDPQDTVSGNKMYKYY